MVRRPWSATVMPGGHRADRVGKTGFCGAELTSWCRSKSKLVCADIAIRLVFAEGEIGGTPCMRSHILVHGATTKFCDNPFIFKNEIEKEGLPRDSTPDLGAQPATPTTPSFSSNY